MELEEAIELTDVLGSELADELSSCDMTVSLDAAALEALCSPDWDAAVLLPSPDVLAGVAWQPAAASISMAARKAIHFIWFCFIALTPFLLGIFWFGFIVFYFLNKSTDYCVIFY